jgi:hypothetical protein
MNQETLFTIKLQGVFRADGFIQDANAPISTITKFTDGTWQLKIGKKTIKDRFSTGYKFISESLQKSLSIQL